MCIQVFPYSHRKCINFFLNILNNYESACKFFVKAIVVTHTVIHVWILNVDQMFNFWQMMDTDEVDNMIICFA